MNNYYKGKAKYILASMVLVLLVGLTVAGTDKVLLAKSFYGILTIDSIPKKKSTATDSLKKSVKPSAADSLKGAAANMAASNDTGITVVKTDTFNLKVSKDSLDAPVVYHADDSLVMDIPNSKIILYGKKTTTKYKDNELTAPGITFDQRNNMITAAFKKDSTGKVIASPSFKQGGLLTVSDSIAFNMKTGKGLTKGTYTQEGEMFIYGERIKKVDSNVFFAYRARFTTCNLDTPHFAFVSKKIKVINNKFAVTGPVHPEFEGVPVPIILPFGIFPMSQGRHSGLIAPTFTTSEQYGIGLENLGYYKVLNQNWDATLRTTIYSYGGWSAGLNSRYYTRYRYQGNLALNFQKTKLNFKGDPDYSTTNTFNITWSHSSDTKARPGVSFSGNINAGSSKFNQYVATNPVRNFQNQLSSTINYAKVWKDKPFNININAGHNQNTTSQLIFVNLPNIGFNVNTLYPFRRKEAVGDLKWYENIGIALNSNVQGQTTFSDSANKKQGIGQQALNNYKWGATHTIPISLSLPPLGALQVSPGISYSEHWYQQKKQLVWDSTRKKIDTTIDKGFYTARQMAFSLGASTRIFGMYGFGKKSRVQAIRHELRPTFGISYQPDMNKQFFRKVQADTTNKNFSTYSIYDGNLSGAFSQGRFGGLSFGLDNNIQMKVRNKNDTSADAVKKVTLIDGLSINSSYNFLIDSFQLSPFSIGARTNLFDKISITASTSLDPYQTDTTGRRINRLVWKDKTFTLGRLTSGQVSISSQFQGGDKSKKPKQSQQNSNSTAINPLTGMPLNEEESEAAYIKKNPAEFADFSIPWSVNFGYSLSFNKLFNTVTKGFKTNVTSSINFNGTINLTPKWQLGLTGIYNISEKSLGVLSLSIAREMHCWQMAINVSPVGRNRFFNITISPKSGLLRDIKVNRTRNFYEL